MKRMVAALAALLIGACEPIPMPVATADADAAGRQFAAPQPDRGALYVYGRSAKINITGNGRMIGDVMKGHWLRADLPAGSIDLRCVGVSRELSSTNLLLDLSPGQIAYVSVGSEWNGTCGMVVEPAATAQPAILAGKRVRELK